MLVTADFDETWYVGLFVSRHFFFPDMKVFAAIVAALALASGVLGDDVAAAGAAAPAQNTANAPAAAPAVNAAPVPAVNPAPAASSG